MASSRPSTPAGRRRAQAGPGRTRGAGGGTKTNGAKPKAPAKPKASKPKASTRKAQPKRAKPKAPANAQKPGSSLKSGRAFPLSSALTIGFCVAVIAAGLAAAYFFWFRDSPLVLVEKVTVEGMEGPEAEAVTAALTRTGSKMTTLNVDDGELAAAVSRYPTVISIESQSDFPHGLTVNVVSRPPVLNATDGGPPVPVAADGTVLRGVDGAGSAVPTLNVSGLPATGKLTGEPLEIAQVAGASPDPLRGLIEDISHVDGGGIELTLEGGIPVMFGDAGQAEDKWAAIAAILADPEVKTLTHLDVRVPERPSIGGAAPARKGE